MNDVLDGTLGNDVISGLSGADTMSGGLGDDYYYLDNLKDLVVERPGEGIDTIISYLPTTVLPDNVENLTLSGASQKSGYGNSLANIIRGTSINNILDGGQGNDLLYGLGGNDVFTIRAGNGSDTIADFKSGAASGAVVSLVGYSFTSFDQIKSSMVQEGTTVALDLGNGETLRFWNQAIGNFDADDFKLQLDTSKWKLTFNDDFDTFSRFNGVDGTWATKQQWDGFAAYTNPSKAERQVYVDSEYKGVKFNVAPEPLGLNPFSLKDGTLEIAVHATPEEDIPYLFGRHYYSGLISSFPSFQQTYGYFEIRAELPSGQALWPAFWLLPADLGPTTELDVFEAVGQDLTSLLMTVHSGSTGAHTKEGTSALTPDLSAGFHTYGVNWAPDYITWYLDGVAVASAATPPDMKNRPMYMVANLAVGGNWAGPPSGNTLTGDPTYQVDYIRAYATENTVSTVSPLVRQGLSGIDYFQGTAYDDTLSGDGQNDMLYGAAGNDKLYGGEGDDILGGGAGNDTLDGGNGVDVAIYNGDSSRFLVVRNGDTPDGYTVIDRGAGGDNQGVDGLTGVESLRFRAIDRTTGDILSSSDVDIAAFSQVTVATNAAGGHDVIVKDATYALPDFATAQADTVVYTGSGPLVLGPGYENAVVTSPTGVMVTGNDGSNILNGGSGADTLSGGAGDDVLRGGAGNDLLDGGKGIDVAVYRGDASRFLVVRDGDTAGQYRVIDTGVDGAQGTDTLTSVELLRFETLDELTGTVVRTAEIAVSEAARVEVRTNAAGGRDVLTADAHLVLTDFATANTDTIYFAGASLTLPEGYENATATGSGVSLTGNAAANVLTGSDGNDVLLGGAGDDVLLGRLGNDVIDGGEGTDTVVFAGGRANYILVTDANVAGAYDVYERNPSAKSNHTTLYRVEKAVFTADGQAALALPAVGDVVVADTPDGGHTTALSDPSLLSFVKATHGVDTLFYGGVGTVQLAAGIENVIATGTYGTTFVGNALNNHMISGIGGAAFIGLAGDDILEGTSLKFTDAVDYSLDAANGGNSGVTVNLAAGVATDGFGGHDTLIHVDNATGTNFADILIGTERANFLRGLDGNDTLIGGDGDDRLDGGAGDDVLDGGAGADQLIGGDGFNTADYSSSLTGLTVDFSNTSNNTGDAFGDRYQKIVGLNGSFFDDRLTGSNLADTIRGQQGNDFISGLAGNDVLYGDAGNDVLFGGAGNDALYGGFGDDRLVGGTAYDVLTGGAGADTFVFQPFEGKTSSDTVTDFVSGIDKLAIDLTGLITPEKVSDVHFATGAHLPPSTNESHVYYETASGRLWWQPVGQDVSQNVLMATLQGKPGVSASDVLFFV